MRPLSCSLLLALAGCEGRPAPVVLHGAACNVVVDIAPLSLEVTDLQGNPLLQSKNGKLVAATVNTPTFDPEITPGWDGYHAHEKPWSEAQGGELTRLGDDSVSLSLFGGNRQFQVDIALTDSGATIDASVVNSADANELTLAFDLPADEHFFGLGERFASTDHRGLGLYAWPEEGGVGGGETNAGAAQGYPFPDGPSMTYFPVPYHYSTRGYAMHLDTTRRTEMHMGDEASDEWRVSVNGTSLPIVLYTSADPLVDLDHYTADTGRPIIPSSWVWGTWRRTGRNTFFEGEPEWQLMRERKIPVTVIEDAVHFLPALSFIGIESDLMAWTHNAHQAGYKVLAYNNPYVAADNANAAPDYMYGATHHLFEQDPDGNPATTIFISGKLLTVSAIDLTNPDAASWFGTLLQRTVDFGYDGWQHDFGEYVKRSSHFYDGRTGEEVHNDYPRLSAKAAYEFMTKAKPGDFVFHVRSGYAGSQAYAPVVWGGDAEADFDDTQGLPSALRGGVNLGLSGVAYWGSDMTGYKCLAPPAEQDKEVFFRWVEFGAVSPIMREENACSNPTEMRTKWNLWNDDDTQTMYRAMASLHTRMAPYLRAMAVQAHEHGTPIMRHPVLLYPSLSDAWSVDDSYFFGSALYAAPVVRRGVTMRTVWLPPGAYLEFTEGTVHNGPAMVTVPAPLDRLPMFLVADQMLPLLDADVQTLGTGTGTVTEADRLDVLDVIVALSANGTATFTMADGTVLTASHMSGTANTTTATDPTQLASCDGCSLVDTFGTVPRVRATSALATESSLVVNGLTLSAKSTVPRHLRWDVRLLP